MFIVQLMDSLKTRIRAIPVFNELLSSKSECEWLKVHMHTREHTQAHTLTHAQMHTDTYMNAHIHTLTPQVKYLSMRCLRPIY